MLGLIENVAREQLSPVEEARAYAVLLDEFGLALGEVAERVGRSKPSVSNRIRLLDLPDDVLGMLERGQLTRGSRARGARRARPRGPPPARARDRAEGPVGARRRAAREVGRREAEAARSVSRPSIPRSRRACATRSQQLTGFDAKVGRGRVELPFADEHELAELAEALERAAAKR